MGSPRMRRLPAVASVVAAVLLGPRLSAQGATEWPVTEGAPGGGRYSPLNQIDRTNVRGLRVAWTYRHGDVRSGGRLPSGGYQGTAFEATPIVVDGRLIFSTPFNRVIALDPESGRELWVFDPKLDRGRRFANLMLSRGVAYWRGGRSSDPCPERVFLATLDARLIALDAETGCPCPDFGRGGTVDLLDGIEHLADPWEYNVTSPATVVGDAVVVGSSIADIVRRIQPSGAVRAYDARTGHQLWQFNTIPQASEFGVETWGRGSWRETGGANVWSTMTVDLERELVFLPVSSAGPDFFGGDRPGPNLFANSVVAVEARTGRRVWHFQATHHDLWDNDVAAPPVLVTLRRGGRAFAALAVLTKTGFLFVLDRESGAPLFPIEERPVPASDVAREEAWPTQPFPVRPPPLVPQRLTEADLWAPDAEGLERCRQLFRSLRHDGPFTPPSERGSLLYPGNAGGVTWSGGAYDSTSGMLYVPVNNWAMAIRLEPLPDDNLQRTDGLVLRPSWSALRWLLRGTGTGLRFRMIRTGFAHRGLPCHRPPWGEIVAVDLARGEVRWRVPLGRTPEGIAGLPNVGALLVTGGGLVFAGGTTDRMLRAFDAGTGAEVAAFPLPAGLHSGPITYAVRNRQYLVVTPGGHRNLRSRLGDYVVAYALPPGSRPSWSRPR